MKLVVLIAALPLLTACMSLKNVNELPPELIYQPPVTGATATITGHLEPRYVKLVGDRLAYIISINGKRIYKDRNQDYDDTWNVVYPIATGEQTVRVKYQMAGYHTIPKDINFVAQAGHNYKLNFVTDIGTSFNSGNSYADVWISDKVDNKPASEVVRLNTVPEPRSYAYPIIINNK